MARAYAGVHLGGVHVDVDLNMFLVTGLGQKIYPTSHNSDLNAIVMEDVDGTHPFNFVQISKSVGCMVPSRIRKLGKVSNQTLDSTA